MLLYDYYRSSASYRVRIALNLKGLEYDKQEVHLVNNGGEQHGEAYRNVNPQALVPSLVDGDNVLIQSMAIIEYLDEQYPEPALLPTASIDRAVVRSMAQIVSCDIHPLNNLRVLKYLKGEFSISDDQKSAWYQHWITQGFIALEALVARHGGKCCFGDTPTQADIALIPQVYNAHRFNCPMDAFPNLVRVNEHCMALPAFAGAKP